MQLVMIGANQRTAAVALREQLAFGVAELPQALAALRQVVDEGFIVSTCNRVEVYAVVGDDMPGARLLQGFLAGWHNLDVEELTDHLVTLQGSDVVRHLCRLAAGLDSMVLGEDQIVGQLKDALASAQKSSSLGPVLQRLLQGALTAGKAVRTQTGIARSRLSVVSVALDLARTTLGGLDARHVLIVGAGQMAELALKHLRGAPTRSICVINRTPVRATALAERYGIGSRPFEELEQALHEADVVISCTSSPEVVLRAEMVARAMAERQSPLLLLDLAVPRDIERPAAELAGVRLYDVDDMQAICAANREARAAEIERADTLIEQAVGGYMEWWASQQATPTIRALRARAEAIRAAEVQRTLARLPELSQHEQDAIHALSAAIINKLLHQPITTLKEPANGELIGAVHRLFQIPDYDQVTS